MRGRAKTRILGKQIVSVYFEVRSQTVVLTGLGAEIATTSHRTTSTYVVGSSRERRFRLELWPVLPRALRRENLTTVFPRPKIPSHFLSTGSPSQVRGTGELQSTRPPGLLRRTLAFTPLSTSTIWQRRFASRHAPAHCFEPDGRAVSCFRVKSMSTRRTVDTTLRWTRPEKRGTTHSSECDLPCKL